MAQIAEDYVSPSVRWGMLKQDHPDAVFEFTHVIGVEIGIPEKFGGEEEYCVCQILLSPTDELPIIGYKPISDARNGKNDHASDAWNILCTKALGRAVKRAGYDDTASALKVLVTYQQRKAEHGAISGNVLADGDYLHRVAETSNEVVTEPLPTEEQAIEMVTEQLGGELIEDEWDSDSHMNGCHEEIKKIISRLPDSSIDKAREYRKTIAGNEWPITSVSKFNTFQLFIEDLVAQNESDDLEEEF